MQWIIHVRQSTREYIKLAVLTKRLYNNVLERVIVLEPLLAFLVVSSFNVNTEERRALPDDTFLNHCVDLARVSLTGDHWLSIPCYTIYGNIIELMRHHHKVTKIRCYKSCSYIYLCMFICTVYTNVRGVVNV